jgi:hypothetical protein
MLTVQSYKCKGPYSRDFSTKGPGEGKSWHPGVKGHKLRADAISFALLSILREAVEVVRVAVQEDKWSRSTDTSSNLGRLKAMAASSLRQSGVDPSTIFATESTRRLHVRRASTNYSESNIVNKRNLHPLVCPETDCLFNASCFTGMSMDTFTISSKTVQL